MSQRRLAQLHGGGERAPARADSGAIAVSAAVGMMERALTQHVGALVVRGEISSLRRWRNGNLYFDLRDARSNLPCMMRDGFARRLAFDLQDGMEVIAHGRAALYRGQMKAQLMVNRLEGAGEGQFLAMLAKLREKLAAEGLFDEDRKQPLPSFVRTVGVVTSPQGAALQDVIKVLRARHSKVSLVLAPTRVQGQGADVLIAEQIERLDRSGRCDVLIVGRGGGSLEDLICWSSERVVRAVAACRTPVVVGVGHETDISLADLAGDVRAATPTHAAQLAVPLERDQRAAIEKGLARLVRATHHQRDRAAARLGKARHGLHPPHTARAHRQLTQGRDQLAHAGRQLFAQRRRDLDQLAARLDACAPRNELRQRRERLSALAAQVFSARPALAGPRAALVAQHARLDRAVAQAQDRRRDALARAAGALTQLSPLQVLSRGYALVLDEQTERLLPSAAAAADATDVRIRFTDGEVRATIAPVRDAGEGDDG